MPWCCCCLLASKLVELGDSLARPILRDAAECLVVQFDSYVRPDVACNLADHNVVAPSSHTRASYQKVALLLSPSELQGQSKTSSQDDSVLLAINPDRNSVAPLVRKVINRCQKRGGGAVWPGLNLPVYESAMRQSLG